MQNTEATHNQGLFNNLKISNQTTAGVGDVLILFLPKAQRDHRNYLHTLQVCLITELGSALMLVGLQPKQVKKCSTEMRCSITVFKFTLRPQFNWLTQKLFAPPPQFAFVRFLFIFSKSLHPGTVRDRYQPSIILKVTCRTVTVWHPFALSITNAEEKQSMLFTKITTSRVTMLFKRISVFT